MSMSTRKPTSNVAPRLLPVERLLAGLLRNGAVVASVWLAAGLMLDMIGEASDAAQSGNRLAEGCLAVGIVLLIALPVLRVALTTAVFLFERDYVFAAISGAVLLIIAIGFLLGVLAPNAGPH